MVRLSATYLLATTVQLQLSTRRFWQYIEVEGVSDLVHMLHRLSTMQSPIAEGADVTTGEVAAAQLAQLITANAELDEAIIMVCKHLLITEIWQQREAGALVGDMGRDLRWCIPIF
jgi:hypothetical protein